MKRRNFLKSGIAAVSSLSLTGNLVASTAAADFTGKIMTVTGAISPTQVGIFLPHEHVMSIFGAPPARKPNYDQKKLFDGVLPYLKRIKSLGGNALADCTATYFGRDPLTLKELSEKSGLKILTNTGYYGAANDRYIPEQAFTDPVEKLARRWIGEWEHGIEGTGIRPGFVKIGVDSGPLSQIDAKLVRAAARTHLQTGLVLAIHTSNNPEAAMQQLDILKEENVHPNAWIWVHANKVKETKFLLRAAEKGAWIEFDGISPENREQHLNLIKLMKENGYFRQILLSHDGNSFRANNRPPKPYHFLFTDFIPALKVAGYTRQEIQTLTTENPVRAFTVQVRKL